ncbi:MAG: alpha/beta hydrolase fold domain-containing protein [Lewinellaceae bacterium]|nr:alpha/beta hydrolase fold domain-containing protein [Lewinellaceae bacterium]
MCRPTVLDTTQTMRSFIFMAIMTFKGLFAAAQGTPYPGQPAGGPGGAEYSHRSLAFYDAATRADGYWLFEPADPRPDSADVVVFMHGYGAYNPTAYGKWIKHLVAKGNIVIYPRYQKNLLFPRADAFPANAAKGIRDALALLQTGDHVRPRTDKVAYIGHSYGGVITANLGVNWKKHHIPKPTAMLLCQPGSGPLKGARLGNYAGLDPDLNLVIIVGEDDYVVGHEFGQLVFKTAVNTANRNLVLQHRDTDGHRWVLATHSEPYCYDLDFDTGVRNYTTKRVFQTSRLNEVDFNCYWKLGDALIEFTRHGRYGDVAFGNTPRQRYLGQWANEKYMRPLEVFIPQKTTAAALETAGGGTEK